MTVKVYINNEQVTLFKDEAISITSSVLDIEDITKNTTDYSKTFNVPANENNNKLFKHYYNADIDNLFDARVTVDGHIELDGFIYRVGKFVLRSVKVEKGVASSYVINFWGNLVSLVDLLGDDMLSDLDLSVYDHNYQDYIIERGLRIDVRVGITGDLVYTPIAKKQYFYRSGGSDPNTSISANISYNGATGDNGINWDELKPSLKIIRILETIESKYGLTFSRQFFGSSTFTDLFIWLNNDAELDGMGGRQTDITWTSGNSIHAGGYPTQYFDYPTENNPPDTQNISFELRTFIQPAVGYEEIPYTIRCHDNSAIINNILSEKTAVGNTSLSALVEWHENQPPFHIVSWSIECSEEFQFTSAMDESRIRNGFYDGSWTSQASLQAIDSYFVTSKNIPELSVIDFLKGLFQAFKLVIIPLADDSIYVNTLTGYYSEGTLLDLTSAIDTSKLTVERGNILSKINYNFAEPSTILNQTFKENNSVAYGDEELLLKDNDGKLLQGGTVDVKLPFETILFERLVDVTDGASTNIQVGTIFDRDRKTVNPKPVLHYVTNVSTSAKPVAFINDDDSKTSINSSLNIPMSSTFSIDLSQPVDVFLFSAEFNTWDNQLMSNTLYAKYHAPYINDIFNAKRRNYTLRAILPLRALLEITLNDIIKIHDNYFRIDNFTINSITGEAELKLFNSLNITVDSFSTATTRIELSSSAQIWSGFVTNLIPYTSQLIDVGFGTSWIVVSDNGTNIEFTVTQNIGQTRSVQVKLIKTGTLEEILFTITQTYDPISPTVDNTNITVDNNNITI